MLDHPSLPIRQRRVRRRGEPPFQVLVEQLFHVLGFINPRRSFRREFFNVFVQLWPRRDSLSVVHQHRARPVKPVGAVHQYQPLTFPFAEELADFVHEVLGRDGVGRGVFPDARCKQNKTSN